MGCRRKDENQETLEFLIMIGLIIFLMPFAGLFLMGRNSVSAKIWGVILLILGIFLWITLAQIL